MKFIGRDKELRLLNDLFLSEGGRIAVVYGRRRVGKSTLIRKFAEQKTAYFFEGLEGGRTPTQLETFRNQLASQTNLLSLSDTTFGSWNGAFSMLTEVISKHQEKVVVVFDELQWTAVRRAKLVALLKYYWDNFWKGNVFLILCGSIASFMVNNVIKSKALYGRISLELLVGKLKPGEIRDLLERRSPEEILKYILVFGGVPKYLEEIRTNRSFQDNINRLCFQNHGVMLKEFDRIFYGQFPEYQRYLDIVKIIASRPSTFEEIAKKTKLGSGGGLSSYLKNLLDAEFIAQRRNFNAGAKSRNQKYILKDEYIAFYLKFIAPNMEAIELNEDRQLFAKLVLPTWHSWLGLAFERYCFSQAPIIAQCMGFRDELAAVYSLYDIKERGFQIDLIFKRFDKVIVITEIKLHNQPISPAIIPAMKRKESLLKVPRGFSVERALVSLYGGDEGLKASKWFDYDVSAADILST